MDILFYDRKNKCNVLASQLVRTKIVRDYLAGDSQETPKSFEDFMPKGKGNMQTDPYGRMYWVQEITSELGYKSEKCPSYQNYDKHLMQSDLVFLEVVE